MMLMIASRSADGLVVAHMKKYDRFPSDKMCSDRRKRMVLLNMAPDRLDP